MIIDFNTLKSLTTPGMYGGTGEMTCRVYIDKKYHIIPTVIHLGGSIGPHTQSGGHDLNYIISGTGTAVCNGVKEALHPGVMHICPKRSAHSIINTGTEDLVMLTLVVIDHEA